MQVVSIISTKGGVGKTTTAANLGGLAADARPARAAARSRRAAHLVLYYELATARRAASMSCWPSTSATLSARVPHDHRGPGPGAVQRPPGRAEHLIAACAGWPPAAAASAAGTSSLYDLVLIDTQGAFRAAGDGGARLRPCALSPVTPEILAARELRRGTMQLLEDIAPYRHWASSRRRCTCSSTASIRCRRTPADPAGAARSVPDHAGIRVFATDVPPLKLIRVPRRAACRCIGSSTASRRAGSLPPARHDARDLAERSRNGRTDLPQCPVARHVLLMPGGPMANA